MKDTNQVKCFKSLPAGAYRIIFDPSGFYAFESLDINSNYNYSIPIIVVEQLTPGVSELLRNIEQEVLVLFNDFKFYLK